MGDKFCLSENIQRELIITIDNCGKILEASQNVFKILGYKVEDMVAKNIKSYIQDDALKFKIETPTNCTLEIIDAYEQKRYFDAELHPLLNQDNAIEAITMSLFDIGKYKDIEKKAEQFKRICENSKDIIYTMDVKPEIKFTYVNPALSEIIGVTPEENLENPLIPFEVVHPDDLKYLHQKADGTADFSKPIQTRFMNKQGKYVWLEDFTVPVYDEQGELIGLEGVCRDIQARKELEERLERLGYWDGLTEVYNKNYFLKELGLLNSINNMSLGIVVCDLDNLKEINDVYGHLNGDLLLQNAAKILKETFNGEHIIARTGGDEFVVIIKNYTHYEALKQYYKLGNTISVYNENKNNIPIMMSTGFSYSDSSVGLSENILSMADKNMYKQKRIRKKNKLID